PAPPVSCGTASCGTACALCRRPSPRSSSFQSSVVDSVVAAIFAPSGRRRRATGFPRGFPPSGLRPKLLINNGLSRVAPLSIDKRDALGTPPERPRNGLSCRYGITASQRRPAASISPLADRKAATTGEHRRPTPSAARQPDLEQVERLFVRQLLN